MEALRRATIHSRRETLKYLHPMLIKQGCAPALIRASTGTRTAALPQQHNYPPKRAASPDGAGRKRKCLKAVPYRPDIWVDSVLSIQQAPERSTSKLQDLQNFLGYQFKQEQLLAQACTHSADKQALSYRQLAFIGDATLWMLFSEHAFHTFGAAEDPTTGAWPAHMSTLLSRANCAATARQWGLHHYLQHCRSSSSSRSSRSSGMYNGSWGSDSLAEMFEGLIGALLLDSNYATVQQLLQPWMAAAFDASRAAAPVRLAGRQAAGQPGLQLHSSSTSTSMSWLHQQHLAVLLHQQLQQQCKYTFKDNSIVHTCSRHVLQLLLHGTSDAQADQWHFLGYSLLQFAAARHAYEQQCQQPGIGLLHQQQKLQQPPKEHTHAGRQQQKQQQWSWWQQHFNLGHSASADFNTNLLSMGSSSSSYSDSPTNSYTSNIMTPPSLVAAGSSSDDDSNNSSSVNQVQLMSKQMEKLTTIRHRCKIWLQLGLDPASFCPADSYVLCSKWKLQKGVVSRCLDLLLAAVYLDGGMQPVMLVLDALLRNTPPTGLDKSWIPTWARRHGQWQNVKQQ